MKLQSADRSRFYGLLFPAMIEGLFTQLFSLVDSVMVGHIPLSTVAVAAVGLCASPINLILCVLSAFFIGTTAAIAWKHGEEDEQAVRDTAAQSMLLALCASVIFSLLSYFGAHTIMRFVCGENEILNTAVLYYRINAIGFFFQIQTICITACFRGIGIAKLPMYYNLLGNLLNVILNYILIYGKLGLPALYVAGAAYATVISKVVVCILSYVLLFCRPSMVRPKKGSRFLPDKSLGVRLLPIGLTSAGEQLILQAGATLTTKIISVLPTAAIAANQIVSGMESFAWSSGDACCTASTSLFGFCLGANDPPHAKAYLRLSERWALIFSAAEISLFCFCGKPLAALFTNDTSLYPMIIELLLISAAALPFINTHKTYSGALRSAGDSFSPLLASFISLWIFRVGLGFLLIRVLGMGILPYRWCLSIDQMVRCICVLLFYRSGRWKRRLHQAC